ncbi:MAG TPA: kelch repeat-containing protein [Candidatus Binataceae bacterium]|nr:kelch repeat-containing protein [Candidatus Binataceae bacterium]
MKPAAKKLPLAGDVLIAGGASGKKSTVKAEFYDPTTKKFTKTGALTTDRMAPCAIALPTAGADSPVLVFGGGQVSAKTKNEVTLTLTPLASAESYDPTSGTFTTLTNAMTAPRMGCTATLLTSGPNTGDVLIVGGLGSTGDAEASAELYNPTNGTFTPTGSMASPRAFHTATLLTTGALAGEVLVTGGLVSAAPGAIDQGVTLKTAELYNPATGKFSTLTSTMADFRAFHTATLLQDGTVLVAGGISNGFSFGAFGATASADIFDPTTQTFTLTSGGGMIEPLAMHGATLLTTGANAGQVLISGGFDADQVVIFSGGSYGAFFGSVAQGAELYDPTTQTFSCINGTTTVQGLTVCAKSMTHPHAGHAAVLLNDGTVLIAGGFGGKKDTSQANINKVAEIYDPTTNTFTKVGAMKTGVAMPAAAVILAPTL